MTTDVAAAGERIESLIAASASGGAVARERAEELVRIVADLYGAGLERLLDLVHEQGGLTDEVIDALARDELVSSLLLVHGLHPYPVETRIRRALATLDADLVEVTADGVALIRIAGGHGCGSAGVRQAVDDAIEAAAPEVTRIEVQQTPAAPAVIPVGSLFARVGAETGTR